jgi:flagellum-specific ATP synthase
MTRTVFDGLRAELAAVPVVRRVGRISGLARGVLEVSGLATQSRMADRVQVESRDGRITGGEVLRLGQDKVGILPDGGTDGLAIGDAVLLAGCGGIAPDDSWVGRVLDPLGRPLDGRPLFRGPALRALRADPPAAAQRKRLGERLETGMCVFNTMLPLVRGQRLGLFAGAGVGKSNLLAKLARGVEADVVVLALVGERGRELRDFTERVLGPYGMSRSVIVAATSDQSPLLRRRCAWTAMTVAEHFRDQGRHVLLLVDSVTRFAEAHREVALAAGEEAGLRGYPPSVAHMIMSLAERAGPGTDGAGDITAVFSVLVAGSDMEEPVADILRGVLDGHVVLDRKIAERGRFPAIDLLRSLSRSLPEAASEAENRLITQTRRLLGAYDRAELMIQAGLYAAGSDQLVDHALRVWPELDSFISDEEPIDIANSFRQLETRLKG